jgi:hypothetical protein
VTSFLVGALVCAGFLAFVWLKGLVNIPDVGRVDRQLGGGGEGSGG